MRSLRLTSPRSSIRKGRVRSSRPVAEALEGRILLYSTFGQWTYSSRITYSFMPDGTSIAGTPSVLFQTLNASFPTITWQTQIEQGASLWESSANLNLAQVSDNGAAFGVNGDQQDDPRFGDIRIGAIPLPSNVLAETFLPPPTNGGTAAGDILFNSTIQWNIGSGYDLATVAAHEFGHALGLGESSDPNAVMYGLYTGVKTSLDSDDVAGIQSLYAAPKYDQFNDAGTHNSSPLTPTNITSYINGSGQVAIAGLDNTLATQSEWYSITVPSTNSGSMVVTVQSSNLSSLAPALSIYTSSLGLVTQASVTNAYGATIWTSNAVTAGQKYYIKVMSGGTYGRVGAYGLEVNFGSQSQPPIQPPNTVVAQQPDGGGGEINNAITAAGGASVTSLENAGAVWTTIGSLQGWAASMVTSTAVQPVAVPVSQPTPTVPTSPIPTVAGPIGPLPAPAPTTVVVASPTTTTGAQAGPISPSASSPSTPHRRHKHVHHAVDATLAEWKGNRKRPQASAKARPALHERS